MVGDVSYSSQHASRSSRRRFRLTSDDRTTIGRLRAHVDADRARLDDKSRAPRQPLTNFTSAALFLAARTCLPPRDGDT